MSFWKALLKNWINPQTEEIHESHARQDFEKKKAPFFRFFSSGLFTSLSDILLLFLASLLTPAAAFVISPLCCLEKWPP